MLFLVNVIYPIHSLTYPTITAKFFSDMFYALPSSAGDRPS